MRSPLTSSPAATGTAAPPPPLGAARAGIEPAGTDGEGLLHDAARLWSGSVAPGLQVRLFRRTLNTPGAPAEVEMRLTAVSYFHLYVNGRYVTRGPTFHHPGPLPVTRLDLTPYWQAGTNVIAVLVYYPGFPTHQVPTGEPGLWAAVGVRERGGNNTRWTVTDAQWRVWEHTGWRAHAVRHGYALGPVEVLDAAAHPWGWYEPGFDDRDWPAAPALGGGDVTPVDVDLPPLRVGWAKAVRFGGGWAVGPEPAPLERGQACEVLGEWLHDEQWAPMPEGGAEAQWFADEGRLEMSGLRRDAGVALVLDLGCEQVGNLCFDLRSDSAGTVEIGWSEVMLDGKPAVTHKGTTYADRLLARAGRQRWEALQFTGLRYVVLILRGFTGSVTIERVGVRTSTAAPPLTARFECSDERLSAIWGLCMRTLRLGTQETIIDCPSREQAPYLGDGHLVGRWLGDFSGDYRHWRYLIQLGFESQADDGLMRDAPLMPVRRSLIDYVLLTVVAVRDYLELTGDSAFARQHLEGCRRALGYFDRRVQADGLLRSSEVPGIRLNVTWDIAGPPRRTPSLDPHVFIDHAGLGGHNVGDPGIERHGRSAALNALYVLACDALAYLEERVGEPAQAPARRSAAQRARDAASAYWDPERGLFIDAVGDDGAPYPPVSEQTNILAAIAGFTAPTAWAQLLPRVLDPGTGAARCGPYFFGYLLPLMGRLGLHGQALTLIGEKWGRMLDGGATTLWETFAGDCMDTWCHAWSAAPASFLVRHIVGLQTDPADPTRLTLRPRYDLLREAEAAVPWLGGEVAVSWRTEEDRVALRVALPDGCDAEFYRLDADQPVAVKADAQIDLPIPRPVQAV